MPLSPRHRRLIADLKQMNELSDETPELIFRAEGDPAEQYELMLSTPGLARAPAGGLVIRTVHRCAVYLHADYPRRPPIMTWLTPIVHPNILPPDRNGGVCIGSWSASESLADLTRRLTDLVSYRSFNVEDPLDPDAAELVRVLELKPGLDLSGVVARQVRVEQAAVSVTQAGAGWLS